MHGEPLSDEPLVRAIHPDGAGWIEIATSFGQHVPDESADRLAHGWGVADHDHDVQAYARVEV